MNLQKHATKAKEKKDGQVLETRQIEFDQKYNDVMINMLEREYKLNTDSRRLIMNLRSKARKVFLEADRQDALLALYTKGKRLEVNKLGCAT